MIPYIQYITDEMTKRLSQVISEDLSPERQEEDKPERGRQNRVEKE